MRYPRREPRKTHTPVGRVVQYGERVKRIGIALLSAPLLAAAQSPVALAPAALIALVPWLWAIRRAARGEALVLGALVGTLYGCLAAPWIPDALRSLGSSAPTALLGMVVTAAWAKLPLFVSASWIAHRLRDRSPGLQIAAVALAFGLGEWANGVLRLGVPWALVGHSQLAMPGVAQLAVVGGVPVLSVWLVSINAAIALALGGCRSSLRLAVALACSWLGMAWLGVPVAELARPPLLGAAETKLLIVQPEIPRYARWDADAQPWVLKTVSDYTSEALAGEQRRVDAIVWPENLLTTPLEADRDLSGALRSQVDQWNVPLITGLVRPSTGGVPREYRSSVVWLEPKRGVVAAVDKFRAIPLLESSRALPGAAALASLFGEAARWPKVEEATTPGASFAARFSITPALCYEVLFPWIVASRRSPESLAILNLADDSWVTGHSATRQLTAWAAFRAIEQRLPLIRVAHGGLSALIDPFGRIVETLPLDTPAHFTVELRHHAPPALQEKFALLGLPLSIGLGVWWILAGWTLRPRSGANFPRS